MGSQHAMVIHMNDRRPAKLENGYTRIANELLEALCGPWFTDRQRRIILFVIRETYGWKQRCRRIPTELISSTIKLDEFHTRREVGKLIRLRVLFREGGQRGEIGINNHIEEWLVFTEQEAASVAETATLNKSTSVAETATLNAASVAETATLSVAETATLGARTPYKDKKRERKGRRKETRAGARETPADAGSPSPAPSRFFVNGYPLEILQAWNAERPDQKLPEVIPPQHQADMHDAIQFVLECVGKSGWPRDRQDVPVWFAELFRFVEDDDDDWLRERDFFYFMNPDRLFRLVNKVTH